MPIISLLTYGFDCAVAADKSLTTFYIVRHAERLDGSADSDLSEAGIRRSVELHRVLSSVSFDAVYSTDFKRTRKTVAPIAKSANLEIKSLPTESNLDGWLANLPVLHEGQNVVIASHSGSPNSSFTAAGIAQRLVGRPVPGITPSEYSKLLIVQILKNDDQETRSFQQNWYGPLKKLSRLNVVGELEEDKDISAVINVDEHLVVGADEEDNIQCLKSIGVGSFQVQPPHSLGNQGELDIEGITQRNNTFFVLGSNCSVRKKVDPQTAKTLTRNYSKNRERFLAEEIKPEPLRDRIYSLTFDPTSDQPPSEINVVFELKDFLETHPVLSPFIGIPSKENGIDVEGIAVDDDHLYLGFRGPVFRSGFVPILKIDPNNAGDAELLFVNLGGAGIRDLRKTENGFLIIAGPNGDSKQPYELHFWDGKDCVPGIRDDEEQTLGKTTLLGRIPTPPGAAAEGITVLSETGTSFEILIAYDGVANGGLTLFRAPRP